MTLGLHYQGLKNQNVEVEVMTCNKGMVNLPWTMKLDLTKWGFPQVGSTRPTSTSSTTKFRS
jgi:hypothetical protein